jgi:hypothetical protein
MASASAGKNFLLEKGEKIGLGIAAGLGVLFIALGLMSLGDRQDASVFANEVDGKATGLNNKMASKDAKIDEVPKGLVMAADKAPVPLLPTSRQYYDPTIPPDGLRITPIVLSVVEGQADIAVLKILANDFVLERDQSTGEVTKVTVGVVAAKDDSKMEGGSKFYDQIKNKFKNQRQPKQRPPGSGLGGPPGFPGGGGMGGGPPPGPGGGGMGGGPPPGPGGGGMGGPPPIGGGGRGGAGGPGPGMPGGGFSGGMYNGSDTAGHRNEEVQYIEGVDDEDIESKLKGRRLAITIKPQRMNVLQASFPYAAQLVKFQQALRFAKVEDILAHPEDLPTFNGVDLQRRLYKQMGKGSSELEMVEDWTSLDLATNSQDLRAVKLFYNEDSNDLKRVMLHEDHMLVMPLPHEIAGKYPEMKLKTLKDSIDKMKKQDAKAPTIPAPSNKFKGEGNPFKRDGSPDANMYNPGGGMGLLPPSGGKNKPTEPAATPTQALPPEHIFVRVYDTDVRDGFVHEYRLRVKLKNPNFNKRDLVSKKSDADPEELPALEEHWYTFPQKVSVPQGGYHYVVEPTPPGKSAYPLPQPKDGQAVLQFQRWYEYLDVTEKLREPIGDWVISELLATRGMFVTGKAFSPLPFWSSVENAFVLRDVAGDKAIKGKEPRKGVLLEPVRPKAMLAVDVAGGKVSQRIGPNPGEGRVNRGVRTDDEVAPEVLLLYQDGTLDLRSSARDKADPQRKEREETFRKWVKDTEEKNPLSPPKKGKDDFP